MAISEQLAHAAAVIDDDPDATNALCIQILNAEPDNAKALFLMGTVMLRAEKFGLAYNLLSRVTEKSPKQAGAWVNLGMAMEGMQMYADAKRAFMNAVVLDGKPEYRANIAMCLMHDGKWQEALNAASVVLDAHPDCKPAAIAHGFASLALGDWAKGWKGYAHTLGGKFRKDVRYGDESPWQGEDTDTLIVYGEQGIGDELMFASCIPDIQNVKNLVIDCDHRLTGLLQRSFPKASVYGTRRDDSVEWLEHHHPTASIASGSLPALFRGNREAFPRQPFLVADPERRIMWRALFDSWGKKPKIGICWTGGRKHTGADKRAVGLESFRPLMQKIDADWISLQYKDPRQEIRESGLNVRHFSAAESQDYDDVAALVAELDVVIGVHTAVLHVAGGLGVEVIALVPEKCSWAYNQPEMLWYPPTYRIHRQKSGESWESTVKRVKWG